RDGELDELLARDLERDARRVLEAKLLLLVARQRPRHARAVAAADAHDRSGEGDEWLRSAACRERQPLELREGERKLRARDLDQRSGRSELLEADLRPRPGTEDDRVLSGSRSEALRAETTDEPIDDTRLPLGRRVEDG